MKKILYSILIMALALAVVLPVTPVLACTPDIHIEKYTLGCDGNYGDGVNVIAGNQVTWKYKVTNIGSSDSLFRNVVVTDSVAGVNPAYISGDTDGDSKLDPGETWIYQATGTAVSGNYSNTGTARGDGNNGYADTASDTSSYFGGAPGINIDKTTNGGDGLEIAVGDPVTWEYEVTNTGNVPLSNVSVTDSVVGVTPAYVSGDTNTNNKLDLTETWTFTASGTAISGNYSNTGTATGKWACGTVTDTDNSSYSNGGGGPHEEPEVGGDIYPINKVMMLLPIFALATVILSGAGILIRRRQTQR